MHGLKKLALFVSTLLPVVAGAPVVETRQELEASIIPGKYIVTLNKDVALTKRDEHISWVNEIHSRSLGRRQLDGEGVNKTYSIADFQGYAGTFDDATLAEIKANPDVVAVEEDKVWKLYALTSQTSATWGLGAISSRTGAGASNYIYDTSAGAGTFAYVIDTGINAAHTEFGGRASHGYSAVSGTTADTMGHGTHCAGTIAGRTYGVSKSASVVGVKVFLGEEGTTADVLDGFDWAVNDIISKARQSTSVISMSLGGPISTAFNAAVNSAHSSGVLSIVAAGNDAQNVANVSPASASNAFTVGATTDADVFATYSNFGAGIDMLAPGSSITSAWIGSTSATNTISGTSMACPHVAGLALYLKALETLTTPATTVARLRALGTTGLITGLRTGTVNLFAYNGNAA